MKIYCSGIGGIGLSAYAALQRARGNDVLGSDKHDSALLEDLLGQGIRVVLNQDGSGVPADADLLVYSEAIPSNAPERERARVFGIPEQSYFQALGELSKSSTVIAVCGSHGKSSTTAMAARMLIAAGRDPSVVVGTKLQELHGRNWRQGGSDLFLVEACEYRRSFHFLSPSMILCTSVDADHFDYYTSQEDYERAFHDFFLRLPQSGCLITHGDDVDCLRVASQSGRRAIDADQLPLPEVRTPGMHMRQNARLVLALAEELGIDRATALEALKGYSGCWRRMEVKAECADGVTVIDDYGHHPKEVAATLTALKEAYPDRRLVCVFQPHTHDRTLKLYDAFTQSFGAADLLVLTDIYEARTEVDTAKADVRTLARDIEKASGVATQFGGPLDETERLVRSEILQSGDVVVCMGAGTITQLAGRLAA